MTKTHIVETVEEYNAEGKLIRKTTTETTEESDAKDHWYPYTVPYFTPSDKWTVVESPAETRIPKVTCVGNGTADSVLPNTTTYSS